MILSVIIFFAYASIHLSDAQECKINCETDDSEVVCGFDARGVTYRMFPNKCSISAYSKCYNVDFMQTDIKYCVNQHRSTRRSGYYEDESCPLFCPEYYRPVCGASKIRGYVYRTFNNGCYLDMINCRGDDDYSGYIEVPLNFCQKHMMKNIFKERVIVSNARDYDDLF